MCPSEGKKRESVAAQRGNFIYGTSFLIYELPSSDHIAAAAALFSDRSANNDYNWATEIGKWGRRNNAKMPAFNLQVRLGAVSG